MRKTSNIFVIAGSVLSLLIATGCTDGGKGKSTGVIQPSGNQSVKVDQVFSLVKAYGGDNSGGASVAELQKAFDALSDDEVKFLAAQKDGDHNVVHYFSMGKATPETAAMLERYLKLNHDADATVIEDQLKKPAGGKTPFALMRGTPRPTGENVGDLQKLVAVVLPYDADRVNDLKDSTNAFDAAEFNTIITKVDSAKMQPVVGSFLTRILIRG